MASFTRSNKPELALDALLLILWLDSNTDWLIKEVFLVLFLISSFGSLIELFLSSILIISISVFCEYLLFWFVGVDSFFEFSKLNWFFWFSLLLFSDLK